MYFNRCRDFISHECEFRCIIRYSKLLYFKLITILIVIITRPFPDHLATDAKSKNVRFFPRLNQQIIWQLYINCHFIFGIFNFITLHLHKTSLWEFSKWKSMNIEVFIFLWDYGDIWVKNLTCEDVGCK